MFEHLFEHLFEQILREKPDGQQPHHAHSAPLSDRRGEQNGRGEVEDGWIEVRYNPCGGHPAGV